MTLVLGAVDGELSVILERMRTSATERWNGFPCARGTIGDEPVVVARVGTGKSLSAMVTQHLIDRCAPHRLIVVGMAGSLREEVAVGDTVIARDTLQHDVDVTALGYEPGRIPHAPARAFACDPGLVELARAVDPPRGRAHLGRIVSGDRFVADAGSRARLVRDYGAHAVEMEGASIGLVAVLNGLPFVVVRSISDRADGAPVDLRRQVRETALDAWYYVERMLAGLRTDRRDREQE